MELGLFMSCEFVGGAEAGSDNCSSVQVAGCIDV